MPNTVYMMLVLLLVGLVGFSLATAGVVGTAAGTTISSDTMFQDENNVDLAMENSTDASLDNSSFSLLDYANNQDNSAEVLTGGQNDKGLLGAIADWRDGEIATDNLLDVINFWRVDEPLLEVVFSNQTSPGGNQVTIDQAFLNEDIDFETDDKLSHNMTVVIQDDAGEELGSSGVLEAGESTDLTVSELDLSDTGDDRNLTAVLFDSDGIEGEPLLVEGDEIQDVAVVTKELSIESDILTSAETFETEIEVTDPGSPVMKSTPATQSGTHTGVILSELSVGTDQQANVSVHVEQSAGPPGDLPQPNIGTEDTILSHFDVTAEPGGNASIDSASLVFGLEQDVVDGQPEDVKVWRYDNGWSQSETKFVNATGDQYFFETNRSGFSTYAVASEISLFGDDPTGPDVINSLDTFNALDKDDDGVLQQFDVAPEVDLTQLDPDADPHLSVWLDDVHLQTNEVDPRLNGTVIVNVDWNDLHALEPDTYDLRVDVRNGSLPTAERIDSESITVEVDPLDAEEFGDINFEEAIEDFNAELREEEQYRVFSDRIYNPQYRLELAVEQGDIVTDVLEDVLSPSLTDVTLSLLKTKIPGGAAIGTADSILDAVLFTTGVAGVAEQASTAIYLQETGDETTELRTTLIQLQQNTEQLYDARQNNEDQVIDTLLEERKLLLENIHEQLPEHTQAVHEAVIEQSVGIEDRHTYAELRSQTELLRMIILADYGLTTQEMFGEPASLARTDTMPTHGWERNDRSVVYDTLAFPADYAVYQVSVGPDEADEPVELRLQSKGPLIEDFDAYLTNEQPFDPAAETGEQFGETELGLWTTRTLEIDEPGEYFVTVRATEGIGMYRFIGTTASLTRFGDAVSVEPITRADPPDTRPNLDLVEAPEPFELEETDHVVYATNESDVTLVWDAVSGETPPDEQEFRYRTDSGDGFTNVTDWQRASTDGEVELDLELDEGVHRIQVVVRNNQFMQSVDSIDVVVDKAEPQTFLTTDNNATSDAAFVKVVPDRRIDSVELEYRELGNSTWVEWKTIEDTDDLGRLEFPYPGEFKLRAKAFSVAGEPGEWDSTNIVYSQEPAIDIVDAPEEFTISSGGTPPPTQRFTESDPVEIEWESSSDLPDSELEYRIRAVEETSWSSWTPVPPSGQINESFTLPEGDHIAELQVRDQFDQVNKNNVSFTVTRANPNVTVAGTDDVERVRADVTVDQRVDTLELQYRPAGSDDEWEVLTTRTHVSAGSSTITGGADPGTYDIRVRGTDYLGNTGTFVEDEAVSFEGESEDINTTVSGGSSTTTSTVGARNWIWVGVSGLGGGGTGGNGIGAGGGGDMVVNAYLLTRDGREDQLASIELSEQDNQTLEIDVPEDLLEDAKGMELVVEGEGTVYLDSLRAFEEELAPPEIEIDPFPPLINESTELSIDTDQYVDGSIIDIGWDLTDDGERDATGQTVTHVFDSPGNHTVHVTISDVFDRNATSDRNVSVIHEGGVNGTVVASGATSVEDTPGTDEPIANATVQIYDGNSTNSTKKISNTTTDGDGVYEFSELRSGNHTLEVTADNFTTEVTSVEIEPGETVAEDFKLDYAESGSISGEVTLDITDPDENVTVTVEVGETNKTSEVILSGNETTAEYIIGDVPVNTDDGYIVSANTTSANYEEATVGNVSVDVGSEKEDVDFEVERLTGGASGMVIASGETAQVSATSTPGEGEGISDTTLTVYAFQDDSAGDPFATLENVTDDDGNFSLDENSLPVGEHLVVMSAEDFAEDDMITTIEEGSNDLGTVELDYAEPGSISGQITASGETTQPEGTPGTGDAIEGLDVTLLNDDGGEVDTNVTDATGEYAFTDVDVDVDDGYTVQVDGGADFTDAETTEILVGVDEEVEQDFELDYAEAGAISGDVTLDIVDPEENVTVTVEIEETGNSTDVTIPGTETVRNYSIEDVPVNVDDGYTVNATAQNYEDDQSESVVVDVGANTSDVNLALERLTGGANGTILASSETASPEGTTPGEGEGIPNATLTVYAFQDDSAGDAFATFENVTDEDGNFSLDKDSIPVGEHLVVMSAEDFAEDDVTTTIEEGSNDLGTVELDYAEAGAISGDVTLDIVDPDENVTVTVEVEETGNTTDVTVPDNETVRNYTIEDVPVNVDDGYTVNATAQNYEDDQSESVVVDVGANTSDVNLALERLTGGANGTILASGETANPEGTTPGEGEGITNATLTVYAFQDDSVGDPFATFENVTDGESNFSLDENSLPVGEHFVIISAEDFAEDDVTTTIEEGSNDLGTVGLDYAEAGAISGDVTLDIADPDENVTVTVEVEETGNSTDVVLPDTETVANYAVEDVPVNVDDGYTINATVTGEERTNYSGPEPDEISDVKVDVGTTSTGHNFTLERLTGGLAGTVTEDDDPVKDATVSVSAFDDDGPTLGTDTTNATGGYSIKELPTGEHFVRVEVNESIVDSADITIEVNETKNQNFSFDPGDPSTEIEDWHDLDAIRTNLDEDYVLVNDLDAETTGYQEHVADPEGGWEPIGERDFDEDTEFTGTFDGNGHEIADLVIDRPDEDYIGLFGAIEDGHIEEVGLNNFSVKGDEGVGSLVGETVFGSKVIESSASGNVTGDERVGGLIGYNLADIINSSVDGTVTGNNSAGGLVGVFHTGTIDNSHYNIDEMTINGENRVTIGGLFNDQYQDWQANDRNLNLSDYDTLEVVDGAVELTNVTTVRHALGFIHNPEYDWRLTTDLDLSDEEPDLYLPYLAGTLNGTGHTLTVAIDEQDVGNVAPIGVVVRPGSVEHLNSAGSVTGGLRVGGLVGLISSGGEVNESWTTTTVAGDTEVGGLIGMNSGDVSNSRGSGNISGDFNVGGLVGLNFLGEVNKSWANATVVGDDSGTGGLVGRNAADVSESWASGNITGNFRVGGLVGLNDHGEVNESWTTTTVAGDTEVGGLIGMNSGDVSNSRGSGNISGDSYVGGLVGLNDHGEVNKSWANATVVGDGHGTGGLVGGNDADVSESWASGNITGNFGVGGLVGTNGITGSISPDGEVRESWANATVMGVNWVGGLVGGNDADVSESWTTGNVSGDSNVAGAVGVNEVDGTISGTYWDTEATGQTDGIGEDDGTSNVTGLTTEEMQGTAAADNMSALDFDNTWQVVTDPDDYPILQWQDMYEIEDWHDLDGIRTNLDGDYVVVNNLDAETAGYQEHVADPEGGWEPIGERDLDEDTEFTGTFDGNGHEIADLVIDQPYEDHLGLFGAIEDGHIEEVGLNNFSVKGGYRLGGLVGWSNGSVSDSWVAGNVTSDYGANVGGLVGRNSNSGHVTGSWANTTVTGANWVGGLVGSNLGSVNDSLATGSVTGESRVGGLVGFIDGGTVSDSWTNATVSGDATVGGLTGTNFGTVSNSWANATVAGNATVGGLVGTGSQIENSHYNIDEVTINGDNRVTIGGLFDDQYQDWRANDKNVDIDDYDTLEEVNGTIQLTNATAVRDALGFIQDPAHDWRLTTDLNLSDEEPDLYLPSLGGTLNGTGHTLTVAVDEPDVANVGPIGTVAETGAVEQLDTAGSVTGGSTVGGLVGSSSGVVEESSASVVVTGGIIVGGLVGSSSGVVEESSASGTVTGESGVGGLVGQVVWTGGVVEESSASGTVTGESSVGGLVGSSSGVVEESSASGTVTGESSVGGLVGLSGGVVEESSASAMVTGESAVGGLVGVSHDVVNESWTTGNVSGDSDVAGAVGVNEVDGTISGTYWDTEATGQADGIGDNIGSSNITGLTTVEMQGTAAADNMSALDFENTWQVVTDPDDYPVLRALAGGQEPSTNITVNFSDEVADAGEDAEMSFDIEDGADSNAEVGAFSVEVD